MKILLVQPYDRTNDIRLFGKVVMGQLTLPLLASFVPEEHEVRIADENVEPIDYDWPDVVGITTMTVTAPRAYAIADDFRKRGKKVILGGVHPTHLPEESLEHADVVVIGEAEGLFEEVLSDLAARKAKRLYEREARPDLAGLPTPRNDLVNFSKYLDIPRVETSRGCPFNCSFCSTTAMFGTKMRYRPVDDVIRELKSIRAKRVFITDNNIFGNPKYAEKLFRALIPLKIMWFGQASLNMARDYKLLELASRSGCFGLLIGFESLSNDVIKSLGKNVNKVAEYAHDIKRLHKHGIGIIGCFVFGFDEEDGTTFDQTVDFVKKLNIDVPQFSVLMPYPGTALREALENEGRILHNNWDGYQAQAVYIPAKMSPDELTDGVRVACRKVYSWPQIFRRVIRGFPYLRSFYKSGIFLGVNAVYRWKQRIVVDDN